MNLPLILGLLCSIFGLVGLILITVCAVIRCPRCGQHHVTESECDKFNWPKK